MSFFAELKRRNVVRMGIAYVLVAWLLLQGVDFALDVADAPGWILKVFVIAAAAGLPIALIFSWVFELTPDGLKRESEVDRAQSITPQTGRKLDRLIIAALAGVVAILLADKFLPDIATGEGIGERPNPDQQAALRDTAPAVAAPEAVAVPAALSVAVLPFAVLSSGADDAYFADGLTEEILNALSQLPELLVTARTSAFSFKGQDLPVQEIAAKLGVRHIVEGSVRRSGDRLRVTAQLIRAEDGFHVWSENYDSMELDTIAVQEDIAEKIALSLDVVLDDGKREAMRRAGLRDVEAFIAFQKGVELYEKAHGAVDQLETLREANTYFDRVIERVPDYPAAYGYRSDLYVHLLNAEATAQPLEGALPEDLAEAFDRARADFEAVHRYARSDAERENAEFDLAYIESNWAGMPARIERFIARSGCDDFTWIENISVTFGYAERLAPRFEEYLNCNPLASTSWRRNVRNLLWAGNAAAALEVARQGVQRAPGPWLAGQLIASLVALGQFDAAEEAVATYLREPADVLINRMMIAAARVDQATIAKLLEEWEKGPVKDDYWGLIFPAWLGEREAANGVAARIDAYAFGSPALSTILLWCLCGAPWDLEATPRFAADLAESGLPWPPVSPIRFPLKEAGFAEQVTLRTAR